MTKSARFPVRSLVRSSFARFDNFAPQKKIVKGTTKWYGPNRPSCIKEGN